MGTAGNTTAFRIKLVVDTANQRVLFAEASKDAVDYLHSLLASLAFENATEAGCVGNFYDSVEQLDVAARIVTDLLPSPAPAAAPFAVQAEAKRFFQCRYKHVRVRCARYVAEKSGAVCPSCGREMAAEVPRGSPGASCSSGENASTGSGRGREDASMIMCLLKDDLTVMPVPAAKIALARYTALYVLSDVVSAAALEERTVMLGYTEVID